MGLLRALVMVASLSACETSGIEIVVRTPDEGGVAPDRIRLFVGRQVDSVDVTESIAPESFAFGQERHGNLWVRDTFNERDLFEDVGPGETVSFGFLAQADHQELGAIVAVGFTGDQITSAGSLFHLKTGLDVVLVYELQLHPAIDPRDPRDPPKPAPGLEVVVWGAQPGDESCVHVANTRDDRIEMHRHDNIFLVTSDDDRDCDGFADSDTRECTPAVHRGSAPPRPQDLTCSMSVVEGSAIWCVLAGATCTDDTPQDRSECVASKYCAPDTVCSVCANVATGMSREDCVKDPFARAGALEMYGIKCHVATIQDDPGQPAKLCDTALALPLELPPTMTAPTCSDATITRPGAPTDHRLVVDEMEFGVYATRECTFELKPKGKTADDRLPISGLVTIDMSTERSIALPIRIFVDVPTPDCSQPRGCVFVNNLTDHDRPASCLLGN